MYDKATLRQLRFLLALASEGSVSKAAESLFTTPSSLRTGVQELEHAIGLKLIYRSTRGVRLTDAGEKFLPIAERLIRDFELSIVDMRAMAQGERGHVNILAGASVTVHLLAPAISAFTSRFPHVTFGVRNPAHGDVERQLLSGECDLALFDKWSVDARLRYRRLLRDRLAAFVCNSHPLADKPGPIIWSDLVAYPYVAIQGVPVVNDVQRKPKHEVSSLNLITALLEQTNGFTIAGSLTQGTAGTKMLCMKSLEGPVFEREVCVISHRGRDLSPISLKLLQFIDVQRQALRISEGIRT